MDGVSRRAALLALTGSGRQRIISVPDPFLRSPGCSLGSRPAAPAGWRRRARNLRTLWRRAAAVFRAERAAERALRLGKAATDVWPRRRLPSMCALNPRRNSAPDASTPIRPDLLAGALRQALGTASSAGRAIHLTGRVARFVRSKQHVNRRKLGRLARPAKRRIGAERRQLVGGLPAAWLERSPNRPRRDGVYADALVRHLLGEALSEIHDRRLRRRVVEQDFRRVIGVD